MELDDAWTRTHAGLWRKGHIVWVPAGVWEAVLNHEHTIPTAGHPGVRKMKSALLKSYWWPDIEEDAERYVSGCETCQRIKPDRMKCAAPLYPHSIPEGPWMTISWDIVGPLPQSHGFDSILVIVDKFMKRTLIEPIRFNLTGLGAARILRDRVF